MLTSVCADETSRTVGHGVVVVTSCVIDAGGMCVSFGRAVPVSGGLFSLFHVTRGDRKNGRDRFAKTRNGEFVTYVNKTDEITVGHEDVVVDT